MRVEAQRWLDEEAADRYLLTHHARTLFCPGCRRVAFPAGQLAERGAEWALLHPPGCFLAPPVDLTSAARHRQVHELLAAEAVEAAWRSTLAKLDESAARPVISRTDLIS